MTCPDLVAAELRARQRRQQAGRRRGLEQRAAKVPLFRDEIIERELAERADYFAAEPSSRDIEIASFRAAQRASGGALGADALYDYLTETYESSGIRFAFTAMAYRAYAAQVLDWLTLLRTDIWASQMTTSGPHYRADVWHTALREHGYEREAWSIHAAHTDNPAATLLQYDRLIAHRTPAPERPPEQLTLF